MPKQRVFIVEDDELTRHRLSAHVQAHPDLDVVGTAGSLAEARDQATPLQQADVLLVDLGLPDGDGEDGDLLVDTLDAHPKLDEELDHPE